MPKAFTCQLPTCNAEIHVGDAQWIMIIDEEQDEFKVKKIGICETCHEMLFEKEQSYEHKLNAAIATYTIEKYHQIGGMPEPGIYEQGLQAGLKPIMDLLLHTEKPERKEDQS